MNRESHETHTRLSLTQPENELLDCRSDRTMKLSHPDRYLRSLFNSSIHDSRGSLALHTSVAEDLEHSNIIDGTRCARGETEEQSPIIHPSTYLDGVDLLFFPPLNLRTTKTMRTALLHFFNVTNPYIFLSRTQQIAHKDFVFKLLATEPQLCFGLIGYAAADLESRTGSTIFDRDISRLVNESYPSMAASSLYQALCVSAVNEKLSGPEATIASTIWAIVCLLAIELIAGHKENLVIHLKGLHTVLSLRGQTEILDTIPPCVLELLVQYATPIVIIGEKSDSVCRCWSMCLFVLEDNSILPPFEVRTITTTQMPCVAKVPELKAMTTGFATLDIMSSFEPTFVICLQRLRRVLTTREVSLTREYPANMDIVGLHMERLHLLHALYALPSKQSYWSFDTRQEICRLATLAFCHGHYMEREAARNSILFLSLAERMLRALNGVDITSLCKLSPGLSIWVLLMACYVISDTRRRQLYCSLLAKRVGDMALSIDRAEALVSRFFYLKRIFRQALEEAYVEAP